MSFFNTGIKILGVGVTTFFIIFFYLCLGWTERLGIRPEETGKKNIKVAAISALTVSVLYSFKIFLIGLGVLALVSLLLKYIP